ncbi:MAG TPA: hypothetical protein VHK06_06500 [Candidatus Limnocylindria bacterium]|nr:hypothetical protein [Candidatus Limnocylindria bacterium]
MLGPDRAPTPFTADEIRRGCPAGRTIRLLVELDGQAAYLRLNRFVDCDEGGATIERQRLTIDGEAVGGTEADRVTWHDLQAHASFPARQTLIASEPLDLPLGVLDCLRYTVTDGPTVETFWFARTAPGMPVKYMTEEGGRVTSSVTMIGDEVA